MLFFPDRHMIVHYFNKMSMYDTTLAIDLTDLPGSVEVNADVPAELSERREGQVALERINAAIENTLKLQAFLNTLRYSGASKCRMMADDVFIGLADLRRMVTAANAGDTVAAAQIPGLMEAFKESLNFSELLKGNRGYMKDGERVYAAYIYKTIDRLSKTFDSVSEAVLPLSEAAEVQSVRLKVRTQLDAVGDFKFNTKEGIKSFAQTGVQTYQPVVTVEEPKPLPFNLDWNVSATGKAHIEPAPFTQLESDWFKKEVQAPAEGTKDAPSTARQGFFSRMMSALGDMAGSVTRRLPRFGGAAVLALAACGEPAEPTTTFETLPPAPSVIAPQIPPIPAAPAATNPTEDWNISDTRDITHAIRSALMNKCGMTRAEAITIEGTFVHNALIKNTDDLNTAVGAKKDSDTDGKWLTAVTTDEARYGNTIPNDYAGVQGDVSNARLVGAHNLSAESVGNMAYSALPVFSTYTCPSF